MGEEDGASGDPFGALSPLNPGVKKVWAVKIALFGAVVLVVAIIHDIANLFDTDRWLPIGITPVAVLIAFGTAVVMIPRLRYRFWKFSLNEQELLLERGILNRVRTIVPLRRVQHLDVSQDILEREFGLGKLIVHTAGTRSSEVVLPGLQLERAEALRDRIKAYIVDDAL